MNAKDPRSLVQKDKTHRQIYADPKIFETELGRIFGHAWVFFGGECLHHLVRRPDDLIIAWKWVNLINSDGPNDGINVPI